MTREAIIFASFNSTAMFSWGQINVTGGYGSMKISLTFFLPVLFIWFCGTSSCFAVEEDPCKDEGIIIKNLSFKEIWYKPEGGSCIVLKRHSTFAVKPAEAIMLFSDIVCKTPYCPARTYADYKSYDLDGNCKVRILPHHTLSDM